MERITKILGKPVLSIYDGEFIGYIKNVFVDEKLRKVLWLCIFDDNTEEEKIISPKGVYSFEGNAVMIKNKADIFLAGTIITKDISLIGYKIYSLDGTVTGKITDIEVDSKLYITNIFQQNDEQFDKTTVLKIGNSIIIQKNSKTDKLNDFRPRQISDLQISNNRKVVALKEQNQNKIQPTKLLTDGYGFLIGRKVGQNIYSENGTLLAKKQSVITAHLIDTASQNGKLKELTTYSLQ